MVSNVSGFPTFSNFSDISLDYEGKFDPATDRGFHKDSKNGLKMVLASKLSEL